MARHATANPPGWITFASYMMALGGLLQSIVGLIAVYRPATFYQATLFGAPRHLFVSDYTHWGWAHFAIGLFLILSSFLLFSGRTWGRVVAVIWATLSAVLNFGFIWSAPLAAILLIIIDVLVIYAALVYGGESGID